MGMTKKAREYQEKMGTDMLSALLETDPEFAERFADFAYDEVVNQDDLDDCTRMMAVLAALLGCQGAESFREMVPAALNMGVTPVQLKEIVYQAVAYLGIGRVLPFLSIVNEILPEASAFPWKGRQKPQWMTAWKKEIRCRWTYSGSI